MNPRDLLLAAEEAVSSGSQHIHLDPFLAGAAAIIVLGVGAQWLGWRMRAPSILLLLTLGFLAGNTHSLFGIGFEGRACPGTPNDEVRSAIAENSLEGIFQDPTVTVPQVVQPTEVRSAIQRAVDDVQSEQVQLRPVVDACNYGSPLFAVVGLAVAVILFEGGLSLRVSELREVGSAIGRLTSVGALVTWGIATFGAWKILGFELNVALLMGAILIVTGPTVIGPLLQLVRPTNRVAQTMKWEGIVIDPVGATITVLVFEAVRVTLEAQAGAAAITATDQAASNLQLIAEGIMRTVVVGSVIGVAAAAILVLALSRFWMPDHLENPITLLLLAAAFTSSNMLQEESGLLTATVMGIVMANQRKVAFKQIVEFNENLRTLLLAILFIVLGARVELDSLAALGLRSVGMLMLLVLVARPLSVFISTAGMNFKLNERLFMSWLAPRGVVAAAVASLLALDLTELLEQIEGPSLQLNQMSASISRLVPEVFFVIVSTVALYGLTARTVARILKVAKPRAQGVLFVGAYAWVRRMASALQQSGIKVLLVDTNPENLEAAKREGLQIAEANALAEDLPEHLNLDGIGRVLAMTSNTELNQLIAVRFTEHFGRQQVYQLHPENVDDSDTDHLRGRLLFGTHETFTNLTLRNAQGGRIVTTRISRRLDQQSLEDQYGGKAIPLFLITENGELVVYTRTQRPSPRPGQTLISLVSKPAAMVLD